MQAVKAIYKNGSIQLLTPLQGIEEAELFVIVLDKNDQARGVAESFRVREASSEDNFRAIGLSSFLIRKKTTILTGRSCLMPSLGDIVLPDFTYADL